MTELTLFDTLTKPEPMLTKAGRLRSRRCVSLSIDRTSKVLTAAIGRADPREDIRISMTQPDAIALGRELNSALRIKINTVVNRLNHDQDLTAAIRHISPNRWKILPMLPVRSHDLAVSDEAFDGFVARHRRLGEVVCVECAGKMSCEFDPTSDNVVVYRLGPPLAPPMHALDPGARPSSTSPRKAWTKTVPSSSRSARPSSKSLTM